MLEIYQKTLSENVTFKNRPTLWQNSTITVMPGKEKRELNLKGLI